MVLRACDWYRLVVCYGYRVGDRSRVSCRGGVRVLGLVHDVSDAVHFGRGGLVVGDAGCCFA